MGYTVCSEAVLKLRNEQLLEYVRFKIEEIKVIDSIFNKIQHD